MEYSIPIPRGKSGIGMEWNGMEFGIFHVELTSNDVVEMGNHAPKVGYTSDSAVFVLEGP